MEQTKKAFNINLFILKLKGLLSSVIVLLFLVVAFSGVGLYFAPSGREARVTNWSFLGFSKTALESLHDLPGIILVILLLVHFLLNLKIFKNEIISLTRIRRTK
ncbi:MAG: DUF4405 domain-containing protein [Caldisericaceae bacterium]